MLASAGAVETQVMWLQPRVMPANHSPHGGIKVGTHYNTIFKNEFAVHFIIGTLYKIGICTRVSGLLN